MNGPVSIAMLNIQRLVCPTIYIYMYIYNYIYIHVYHIYIFTAQNVALCVLIAYYV